MDWPDAVYDKVGNILISRLAGADVRLVQGRVRDRLQGELGAGAARRRGARRQAVRDPGRRLRPSARRARLRRTGRTRSPSRSGELGVFFDTVDRLLGDRQHPGRHGRRLRRPGAGRRAAAPRARHRRLGQARRDPRPGRCASPAAPRELIGVERELRADEIELDERYHAGIYGIPDEHDARRDAARRPHRGHDHRPGLRGEVDGRRSSTSSAAARSRATRPCCTPTSAASRRSTATARCSPDGFGAQPSAARNRSPRSPRRSTGSFAYTSRR